MMSAFSLTSVMTEQTMLGNGPSPVVRAFFLSIGATATAYRIFNNFGIAVALGIGTGILASAALMADERRRAEEQWYLEEERKRKQREAAGLEPEQSKTSFTL
jgi:hypothetical protein